MRAKNIYGFLIVFFKLYFNSRLLRALNATISLSYNNTLIFEASNTNIQYVQKCILHKLNIRFSKKVIAPGF